jgi:hypothetical protein
VTNKRKSIEDSTSTIKKVEIKELERNSMYIHKVELRLAIVKSYESLETKEVMVQKIRKYVIKLKHKT